jgi:hypothetical protein
MSLTARFQGQGALTTPEEFHNHRGPLSPANGVRRDRCLVGTSLGAQFQRELTMFQPPCNANRTPSGAQASGRPPAASGRPRR